MVGLIQALPYQASPVKRLLEQTLTWEGADADMLPTARTYRIARRLHPAELDELVEGYRAGRTVLQLAEQFGIERRAISRHLRKRGIGTKPSELRAEDVSKAVELYREGWSLTRVGEKYGIKGMTVRAYLIEAGVTMRARKGGIQRRQDRI